MYVSIHVLKKQLLQNLVVRRTRSKDFNYLWFQAKNEVFSFIKGFGLAE